MMYFTAVGRFFGGLSPPRIDSHHPLRRDFEAISETANTKVEAGKSSFSQQTETFLIGFDSDQ